MADDADAWYAWVRAQERTRPSVLDVKPPLRPSSLLFSPWTPGLHVQIEMPLRNSGVVLKKLVLNRPHFNDSAAILTPPHIGAKAELLLLDVPQHNSIDPETRFSGPS